MINWNHWVTTGEELESREFLLKNDRWQLFIQKSSLYLYCQCERDIPIKRNEKKVSKKFGKTEKSPYL